MSVELGFLAALAAGVAAFAIGRIISEFRAATAWHEAARAIGLTSIREKKFLGMLQDLRGESGDFTVILETYKAGKNESATRLSVTDRRERIPVSLDLRAEGFSSAVEKTFGAKEIEIGDPAFDEQVYVRGPEDVLLAALDEPTRALVLQVAAVGGRIVDGKIRVEWRGGGNKEKLVRSMEAFLAAARSLTRPLDVPQRLVDGLRSDPQPGVRLRCLDLLTRRFPSDERARAAFREVLGSTDTEMRLRAAMALGKEGRETLLEIASNPASAESRAARALAALGRATPVERAAAILNDALRSGRRALAFAAVGALGSSAAAAAVPHLVPFLAQDDAELAVAAARALAEISAPDAEPPLVAALRSENAEVRLAAADGLGRNGSPAAVAPLHAAVDAHALDFDLRSAVRQAIAAIQSRLPGASPGQVSLAEGEAGQVSLVGESRGGRVTMTED
jgi:hypothetical protein